MVHSLITKPAPGVQAERLVTLAVANDPAAFESQRESLCACRHERRHRLRPGVILLVTVNPTLTIRNRELNLDLLDRSQERLSLIPGVVSVSYVRIPPPRDWSRQRVQAAASAASARPVFAKTNYVGPDYLRALGLSPVAGREFMRSDRTHATKVGVINRNFACPYSKESNCSREVPRILAISASLRLST
jgi:hypothetical protein